MATKKTVVEMYEGILAKYALSDEDKAFIEKRIEITKKKNASGKDGEVKPTKTQLENEGIKTVILNVLNGITAPTTISDLMKSSAELGVYSNQKLSSLMTQLLKDKLVIRTEIKGKAYYALPTADNADEG